MDKKILNETKLKILNETKLQINTFKNKENRFDT